MTCRVTLYETAPTRNGLRLLVTPHKCGKPLANIGRRLCREHVAERLRLLKRFGVAA